MEICYEQKTRQGQPQTPLYSKEMCLCNEPTASTAEVAGSQRRVRRRNLAYRSGNPPLSKHEAKRCFRPFATFPVKRLQNKSAKSTQTDTGKLGQLDNCHVKNKPWRYTGEERHPENMYFIQTIN